MAKYVLPELKKPKKENVEAYDPVESDSWYRCVRIPVNKEIMKAMELGKEVTISLKGKIKSLEARESTTQKERQEVELEISSVSTEAGNEFSELAKDDEED